MHVFFVYVPRAMLLLDTAVIQEKMPNLFSRFALIAVHDSKIVCNVKVISSKGTPML